ncbi:hypothetical protein [Nocardia wallacei]|uniref:hypothetical protein n=1 Tax=Nocardia wallacei TaxID=480035 RepID=UPI00245568E2|nr:hypothetical protein [Nocardia wallacei]
MTAPWTHCPSCEGGEGELVDGKWVDCVDCEGQGGWPTENVTGKGGDSAADDVTPVVLATQRVAEAERALTEAKAASIAAQQAFAEARHSE